ncbi:30S ribosomal protein S9 [Candidatus Woesearchaeota archaeon]|nr:30S ribosomal protein S9 [Candidatus Woesearchaeota archaeon]
MLSKSKAINTSGARKRSKARLTLLPGSGLVRINGISLDTFEPKLARMKIMEPLLVVGDIANKVHIEVSVSGGGVMSQVDAVRQAIGRALSELGGEKVRKTLVEYDRTFLVADTRFKETRKPNDSKARAKRQKSYR